jgi:hypothetical protein
LERARELAGESFARSRAALDRARESLRGDTLALEHVTDFVYLRES